MAVESRALIFWGSAGMLTGTLALGSTAAFRTDAPRRTAGGVEALRDAAGPVLRPAAASAMLVLPLEREPAAPAAAAEKAPSVSAIRPPGSSTEGPGGAAVPPLNPAVPPVQRNRAGFSASAPPRSGGRSGPRYGELQAAARASSPALPPGGPSPRAAAPAGSRAGRESSAPPAAESEEARTAPQPTGSTESAASEPPAGAGQRLASSGDPVYRHAAPTLIGDPPARAELAAGGAPAAWPSGGRGGGGGAGRGAGGSPGKSRRASRAAPKPEEKPLAAAAPEPGPAANPFQEGLPPRMVSVGEQINSTGGYRFDGVNDCYGYVRRVWDPLLKERDQAALPVADYPSRDWSPIASWDALRPGDVLATHAGHKWGADWHTGFYAGTDERGVRMIVDNSGSVGAVSKRPAPPGLFKFYYRRTHELLGAAD